jgi:hypothetical protein
MRTQCLLGFDTDPWGAVKGQILIQKTWGRIWGSVSHWVAGSILYREKPCLQSGRPTSVTLDKLLLFSEPSLFLKWGKNYLLYVVINFNGSLLSGVPGSNLPLTWCKQQVGAPSSPPHSDLYCGFIIITNLTGVLYLEVFFNWVLIYVWVQCYFED